MQPIKEEFLLTGPLEPTNEWYAIAKITGIKLYGPGDSYHPDNSHVLPALIRRFHEAKERDAPSVSCWGTGTPLREILHVNDLGEACMFSLEHWRPVEPGPLSFLRGHRLGPQHPRAAGEAML